MLIYKIHGICKPLSRLCNLSSLAWSYATSYNVRVNIENLIETFNRPLAGINFPSRAFLPSEQLTQSTFSNVHTPMWSIQIHPPSTDAVWMVRATTNQLSLQSSNRRQRRNKTTKNLCVYHGYTYLLRRRFFNASSFFVCMVFFVLVTSFLAAAQSPRGFSFSSFFSVLLC